MDYYRPFIITNLSAQNLENVRNFGSMKVYAVASITGGPSDPEFTTSVDHEGEINPQWTDTSINFTLHDPSLQTNCLYLNIEFYCSRTLRHDKYVGGVVVPIKPLFDMVSGDKNVSRGVQYPVVSSSGGEQGFVSFCFEFGEPNIGYGSNVVGRDLCDQPRYREKDWVYGARNVHDVDVEEDEEEEDVNEEVLDDGGDEDGGGADEEDGGDDGEEEEEDEDEEEDINQPLYQGKEWVYGRRNAPDAEEGEEEEEEDEDDGGDEDDEEDREDDDREEKDGDNEKDGDED